MNNLVMIFDDLSADKKRTFLKQNADKKVVMDFSTIDPNPFYHEFPNLIGSFPGLFAIEGKCELHLREEHPDVEAVMRANGLTPVRTSIAGLGFTVPRTLAMIINEAYFALEEKVASASDIDRAMRFGVNYPQGPIGWAKDRERLYVSLLDSLKAASQDNRYEVCRLLRSVN